MYTEIIPSAHINDGLEEEEIKIEYNESFETDPLSEKSINKSFTNYDVPVGLVVNSAKECEASFNNNSATDLEFSTPDDVVVEQIEFDAFTSTAPQVLWYRNIDDSGKLVCQFCDLTYSTIQTVRHHVKTKHPENATALRNIIKNNKRNPKIKCHVCKKRFKMMQTLRDHMKEHCSQNLQQSCKVCYATFNDEKEMIQHLCQKHQISTKTYTCTVCGYKTPKLSHFKQHKNTHIRSKNLKCSFCDYATSYSPNLKIHHRIHSNEKPYFCSYEGCDYRCAAKSALRSHQLKHNRQENMLYCDKCTYTTVYKHSLKKHIDSHERNALKDS